MFQQHCHVTGNVTPLFGSVAGSAFAFAAPRTVDANGCGSLLANGNAQVTGTTMQDTVTFVNDVSAACGTLTGSSTGVIRFTLTKQ